MAILMPIPNMTNLSVANEDYIRALVRLQEQLGRSPRAVELASHMGVGKSTVTERLQRLSRDGFIQYDRYGTICIKSKAKHKGIELTRAHRIIETFLHATLKRPASAVHDEAHKLEHAFTPESIEALYELLGKPQKDPHGQDIPRTPQTL